MKTSQIIELALPAYRAETYYFMCCLVDDLADESVITVSDRTRALRVIRDAIGHQFTLDTYLLDADATYREIRYPGKGELVSYKLPALHAMRVTFWENLIITLKNKGE